jgi:ASCH domain
MGEQLKKALSIRQPYIGWILEGEKTIELRTWTTAYRGPLILHASQRADPGYTGPPEDLGAILGVVDLSEVRPMQWEDEKGAKSSFTPGCYAWIVKNPRRLRRSIPYLGKLGLFKLPADVIRRIKRLLE